MQTYKELDLRPTSQETQLPDLGLKRETLGWLIAARSGHGHYANYHERFGHDDEEDLLCSCGRKRAQLHPFSFTNARVNRAKLWCGKKQKYLAADEVLGTQEGALVFQEWAPATGLFKRRKRVVEEQQEA